MSEEDLVLWSDLQIEKKKRNTQTKGVRIMVYNSAKHANYAILYAPKYMILLNN